MIIIIVDLFDSNSNSNSIDKHRCETIMKASESAYDLQGYTSSFVCGNSKLKIWKVPMLMNKMLIEEQIRFDSVHITPTYLLPILYLQNLGFMERLIMYNFQD